MKIKKLVMMYLMFVIFATSVFATNVTFINRTIGTTSSAFTFGITDFDDDNDYDIISKSGCYTVFFNNTGDMVFSSAQTISSYTNCDVIEDLHIVDVNLDGDLDILSARQALVLLEHNEPGGFPFDWSYVYRTTAPNWCTTRTMNYGDIDGDVSGDIDVVVACGNPPNDDYMIWVENPNNSTGWSDSLNMSGPIHYIQPNDADEHQWSDVEVIDLDEDGDLDVVACSSGTAPGWIVAWYENNGDGTNWTEHDIIYEDCLGIEVVDLDQDGDLDIVQGGNQNVSWLKNDGSESFTSLRIKSLPATYSRHVSTGDIDNDGDIDIAYLENQYLRWLENDGSESFTDYFIYTGSYSGEHDLKVFDLDKDGLLDIVYADGGASKPIIWFENTGTVNITGYSCTSPMFINDTFDYWDNFSNHGWEYWCFNVNGSVCTPPRNDPSTPIPSPFGTNAFGYDDTSTSDYGINRGLRKVVNETTGKIIFSYDVEIGTHVGPFSVARLIIPHYSNWSKYFALDNDIAGYITTQWSTLIGFENCAFANPGLSYNIVLELDIPNKKYNLYINDTSYCYDKTLTTESFSFNVIDIHNYIGNLTATEMYLDNIAVCGGVTAVEGVNCTDSDGSNYFNKGYVIYNNVTYWDTCIKDPPYNVTGSSDVVEMICSGGVVSSSLKDCEDYGGNYTCDDGKCTGNTIPTINSVYSYRNCTGCGDPPWRHDAWYTPDYHIFWEVNATDAEGDDIYVAVDCDVGGGYPYVSDWGPAPSNFTMHNNCTYNMTGNYTAKLFATDYGRWGDYTSFTTDEVVIRECITYHDCDAGYQCNTGTGTCYIPSNVTNCTDTDGGVDYEVKGTITTLWENLTDYCYNALSVYEYWCDPSPSGYSYTIYNCQNIDSGYTCYNGRCQNATPTAYTSLYVRDFDTSAGLEGIKYEFVQYPSYTVVEEGYTPSGGLVTLSLPLGYDYQLVLDDDGAWTYKDWWEERFVLTGTINSYMEQHCSPDCIFLETFSYADSIFHHGWRGNGNYSTYYHPDYGFMLDIDTAISTQDINQPFPEPTKNIQKIEYMLIMADQTPAENQEIYIYLEDVSGNDIFVMRYDIDNTDTIHTYYFDTSWHEISFVQQPQPTLPMTTILYYNEDNGNIDIYFDVLTTGNEVLYVEDNSVINPNILQQIRLDPDTSTYGRNIYIDSVDISQQEVEPDEEQEGSVTNPSQSDLGTPWYRDAEGELHFDASQCEGWKSYLMCAGWKQGVSYVATGASWIFSGIHILYFIIMLIIIIIIGPLLVEFFKPKN